MMRRTATFATLITLVAVLGVSAGGALKSGPQVGAKVPGPFHPLNINGEAAGKKNCLYCANAGNPVAVVFARNLTPEVTKLLSQLDAATVKNSAKNMGSYAVFMSDNEKLEGQLKDLAAQQGLKKLVLSIDNPSGPKAYGIAKDADVTVLLYNEFVVEANHSYARGQLSDAEISKIVSEVSKITK